MSVEQSPLPDFTDPPVVEVALGVQFEPLIALRTPQIGFLWQEFRDRFPKVEEYSPMDSKVERFRPPRVRNVEPRVEFLDKPPVPRCWFLNEAGTELIQVQQDRFVHNWRKVGEEDKYPRYKHIRDTFKKELITFQAFVANEQLGELVPNQCEITYVNHIAAGSGWHTHGQLGKVLTVFTCEHSDEFLSEPEDVRLGIRHAIPGPDGKPLGRLHVTVDPAHRGSDAQAMFIMKLTARGRPVDNGLDGILGFLDVGRDWIVRGFASITTPEMHRIWGRTR